MGTYKIKKGYLIVNNIIWNKLGKEIIIGVSLLIIIPFFFTQAFSQNQEPIIKDFQAPKTVFANQYFYLNATINDPDGWTDIVNVTIEISNDVVLEWINATNTFGRYNNTNNYINIDTENSIKTIIDSETLKLSWRIKISWSYSEDRIDIISSKTKIFDKTQKSGTNSQKSLFQFEDKLVIQQTNFDSERVNPLQNIIFNGSIFYQGTNIPPGTNQSALRFDGIDDYIDCGNNIMLFPRNEITVAAWVKPNNNKNVQQIISSRGNLQIDSGIEFQIVNSRIELFVFIDGVGWKSSGFTPISSEKWSYVVGTYDSDTLKIYVDGELKNLNTQIGHIVQTNEKIVIGRDGIEDSSFYNGIIDEVRLYSRALTSLEIDELYQGIYSDEDELLLYLDFDADINDKSEQNNHCVNYGTSWENGYINGVTINLEFSSTRLISKPYFYSTNGSFSISYEVESTTSSYIYIIYGKTDQTTTQNKTMQIIVDRIISVMGSSKDRTSIGQNVEIYANIYYETDNMIIDDKNAVVYINGTAANWDIINKRWKITANRSSLGSSVFTVNKVSEQYGLEITSDINEVQQVIWDRIIVEKSGTSDERINIGSSSTIFFIIKYEYDSKLFTEGTVLINGKSARYNSVNQRWELSDKRNETQREIYRIDTINDNRYNITIINNIALDPEVIWDRIIIFHFDLNSSSDEIYDNIELSARAYLEYDYHLLGSNDSILVNKNRLLWNYENQLFKGAFSNFTRGQQSFEISSANEMDYNITSFYQMIPNLIIEISDESSNFNAILSGSLEIPIMFIILAITSLIVIHNYRFVKTHIIRSFNAIRHKIKNIEIIFILGGQVMLIIGASLFIWNDWYFSENVLNYAFFLLIIGTMLPIILYIKRKIRN